MGLKIGRVMGILLIPRLLSDSTKNSVLFLYLSEEIFFISSESLFIWLYFEPWLSIFGCTLYA